MNYWTNLLCEISCHYNTFSKKTWKGAGMGDLDENYKLKKGKKWKTQENPLYVDSKRRPSWCRKYNKKRDPCFYCLGAAFGGAKCPFLVISDCNNLEYEAMEVGLKMLQDELVEKHGEFYDLDEVIPRDEKNIKRHNKILDEMEKEDDSRI